VELDITKEVLDHRDRLTTLETQNAEIFRRLGSLEGVPKTLSEMNSQIATLVAKVSNQQWLLGLIVSGLLGIAWMFLSKR
jgi:hypothetical protein